MASPKFLLEDESTFQRIGYSIGLDSFDAQDWAQDVRLECLEKTGIVPSFLKPDPYTRQGLVWHGRSTARRNRRFPVLPKLWKGESFESFAEERSPIQFSAEAETSRNEQLALGLRLLGEGLLSLSIKFRDAWILREIVELEYPKIKAELGLERENTARQRHSRADQRLQEFFRKHQCTFLPCEIASFLLEFQEENVENSE